MCYLGFTLKYSGGKKVGGRDEARLAKMIIIETGLWVHTGPLFLYMFENFHK